MDLTMVYQISPKKIMVRSWRKSRAIARMIFFQVAGACASYRLESVATIGASRLLLRGDTVETRAPAVGVGGWGGDVFLS